MVFENDLKYKFRYIIAIRKREFNTIVNSISTHTICYRKFNYLLKLSLLKKNFANGHFLSMNIIVIFLKFPNYKIFKLHTGI